MRIREFLLAVYDALPQRLPKPFRDHQWRIRFSFLQVYFDHPSVHYEVWVQRKTRRIEIGLHFEGDRDESYRWAAAMAGRALEVQAQLGPEAELEEWTSSWTRLHELHTFQGDLTAALAQQTTDRLARYIAVLEPIVQEERAGVVV